MDVEHLKANKIFEHFLQNEKLLKIPTKRKMKNCEKY